MVDRAFEFVRIAGFQSAQKLRVRQAAAAEGSELEKDAAADTDAEHGKTRLGGRSHTITVRSSRAYVLGQGSGLRDASVCMPIARCAPDSRWCVRNRLCVTLVWAHRMDIRTYAEVAS